MRERYSLSRHYLKTMEISDSGTVVIHNLGVRPKIVHLRPLMENGYACHSWWEYEQPTSKAVYLQSKIPATYIVYIGG